MSEFCNAWNAEEVAAMRETKRLLIADPKFDQNFINDKVICLTCVNCKFRPDSAVKKLKKWTDEMRDSFGL